MNFFFISIRIVNVIHNFLVILLLPFDIIFCFFPGCVIANYTLIKIFFAFYFLVKLPFIN